MDKYDSANDHYCYTQTNVLKNKLNIQDIIHLENAERDITRITIKNVKLKNPPYNLDYMKSLHFELFSTLYDWAGNVRNVNISKGGTFFCIFTRIEAEAEKLFKELEKENWLKELEKKLFCKKLAKYYIEFNMIHPFREGNGRVQRLFFEHLALTAGYDLNWNTIEQHEWIQANIDGVDVDYVPMDEIFNRIVIPCSMIQND